MLSCQKSEQVPQYHTLKDETNRNNNCVLDDDGKVKRLLIRRAGRASLSNPELGASVAGAGSSLQQPPPCAFPPQQPPSAFSAFGAGSSLQQPPPCAFPPQQPPPSAFGLQSPQLPPLQPVPQGPDAEVFALGFLEVELIPSDISWCEATILSNTDCTSC